MSDLAASKFQLSAHQCGAHRLLVCRSCAFAKDVREHNGQRGGQILLEALQTLSAPPHLSIQAFECFGVCDRHCVVALSAPNKFTYLFGGLPAYDSAEAVMDCARLYIRQVDGSLPRSLRPERVKSSLIARIPAV